MTHFELIFIDGVRYGLKSIFCINAHLFQQDLSRDFHPSLSGRPTPDPIVHVRVGPLLHSAFVPAPHGHDGPSVSSSKIRQHWSLDFVVLFPQLPKTSLVLPFLT